MISLLVALLSFNRARVIDLCSTYANKCRYRKLSVAWRETIPPPITPEDASRLVILTLKGHQKADVEVLR